MRTYGLDLAAGGICVAAWMWVTSLAGIGDLLASIVVGSLDTSEITPHAVTTVGVIGSLALLLITVTVAIVTATATATVSACLDGCFPSEASHSSSEHAARLRSEFAGVTPEFISIEAQCC